MSVCLLCYLFQFLFVNDNAHLFDECVIKRRLCNLLTCYVLVLVLNLIGMRTACQW